MEVESAAELQGRRPPPWRRTVAVQAAVCLALYAAFSLGEPQLRPRLGGDALGVGGGGGLSFLSVAGGARPPADQARLLRQVRACASVRSPRSISRLPRPLRVALRFAIIWAL
uniref:Uncharacterized protein n=1 Tax=Aegilops tauschii subsp. strangulata TaxID=200361 RepID=A0A453QYH1_AEGTS